MVAADFVAGAQFQPRGEILGAGKAVQVGTDLGEESLADVGVDTVHRRDVDAELLEEQGADRGVRWFAPPGRRRRRGLRAVLEQGGLPAERRRSRLRERKSQLNPAGNQPARPSLTSRRLRTGSESWRASEMAPSSVGSQVPNRVIEPRDELYRWSLRCRKNVVSTEAPLRFGADVRPGSDRAEQGRFSREDGRASVLLGHNRQRPDR